MVTHATAAGPPSAKPAAGARTRPRYPKLVFGETLTVAIETFRVSKMRFILTSIGMVIGTASLILVVTIGLTGKQYLLQQIQNIGSNMMIAEYQGGGIYGRDASSDFLTLDDLNAVRQQVPGISNASPMIEYHDRITVPGGKERDVEVLGVSWEYMWIRNLVVLSGRFFDDSDTLARDKVAVLTDKLAQTLYGSESNAVGKEIKISGLPFTVIGTFRERVDTLGQSEISDDTILMPYTVARYFTNTDEVKQLFFSVSDPAEVPRATREIREVLQARHRPESVYRVDNLTQLLDVAAKTANTLSRVLLLVSVLTLIISGVGIMNIMLATVNARTREIGVRKAVGATNAEIRGQFLTEAVLISLSGGIVGILLGLAIPFSVRFITNYRLPISGWSVIIAVAVSSFVGVLFGTAPATRAARFDPIESLRYE
ncbi:MAG TPA: ABC transporter permease [Terriglobales bacterium]|nr:ABC transporter permease [Terriglobales bacterium]